MDLIQVHLTIITVILLTQLIHQMRDLMTHLVILHQEQLNQREQYTILVIGGGQIRNGISVR